MRSDPVSWHPPLAQWLIPQQTLFQRLTLILMGSLVLAIMAQIIIPLPFTPVPITGQTLGVMLVGATLGGRLGFLAVMTYLVEGASGLPVFSGGRAGILHLWGPTGGYLLSFPLAAGLIGYLVERFGSDRNLVKMMASMLLCSGLIFLSGATWLGVWLNITGEPIGIQAVLAMGVLPFLPGDLIKNLIASSLLPTTWRLIHQPHSSSR